MDGEQPLGPLVGKVKDFLGKPAPLGYVAGLARGDTGFVTRPDLGPGASLSTELRPSGVPPIPSIGINKKVGEDFELDDDNENEEGLLAARGPLASDDEEADAIFAMVEARLQERRKNKKKPSAHSSTKSGKNNDPLSLFAEEREQLRQVSYTEWEKIPEAGDFTAKRMKKANERDRFTPLPDSLILGAGGFGGAGRNTALDLAVTGQETTANGSAREQVLGAHLDMVMGVNAADSGIDPVGYLRGLEMSADSASNLKDLRRARLLLRSAYQTNPENAAAWVSAARVEEAAQSVKGARLLLEQALQHCPDNVDIWLEAIRMAANSTQKFTVAQRAIKAIPQSPSLWIKAAEVAGDPALARKLLRNGLEEVPNSPVLWKTLIETEDDRENVRVLLAKAVECCPHDIELWIALARVEEYSEARKVLNKARKLNPTRVEVWIAAARLEEAHSSKEEAGPSNVDKIIERAVVELDQLGAQPSREEWLKHAEVCATASDLITTHSIVLNIAELSLGGLALAEKKARWKEEAIRATHPIIARTLLELSCQRSPKDEQSWIDLLENARDLQERDFTLALDALPDSVELWKRYIQWLTRNDNNTEKLDRVVIEAVNSHPENETLLLLGVNTLVDQVKNNDGALKLLCKAVNGVQQKSERAWVEYCKQSYLQNNDLGPLKLALERFPRSDKLFWYQSQWSPQTIDWDKVLTICPQSAELHVAAAEYFVSQGNVPRARAILESGRKNVSSSSPTVMALWLHSIQLEASLGSNQQARSLLNRALQMFPQEGAFCKEAARLEPNPIRKARLMENLKP